MYRSAARSLLQWFRRNPRDLPWRRTRDPYAIWVSEVMLQQTQVATVIPYFERWMAELPDLSALAAAPLTRILHLWAGLGYYRRARNLHTAAKQLARQGQAGPPRFPTDWLMLPGIGRYTAGAICSIAFNDPVPVVDGNVTRVLARWHGWRGRASGADAQRQLWHWASALVEAAHREPDPAHRNCGDLNQALMELGATVCIPRSPRCPACPLSGSCVARRSGHPERYPARPRPIRPSECRWTILVVERHGRFLVRQRPDQVVNGGLWEFPTSESAEAATVVPGLHQSATVGTLRHTITRFRIRAEVVYLPVEALPQSCALDLNALRGGGASRWATYAQLQALPLSGLHRKVVRRFIGGNPRRG